MKVAIVNYTGDRGNWGCQATSYNLFHFLRSGFDLDEDELVTIPFPEEHPYDRLTQQTEGQFIRSLFGAEKHELIDLRRLEDITRDRFGSYFQKAKGSDLIVFQGEGTIGRSAFYSNAQLFALPFIAGRLWQKPIVSLNQTLFANSEDAPVLANIFNGFDVVAVREAASYEFARSIGIDKVLLCPDMAFATEREIPDAVPPIPDRPYFCVSGSSISKRLDAAQYRRLVDLVHGVTGLTPVYIWSRKSDRQLFGNLISRTSISITKAEYPDYRQIIPVLAGAQFVLGGRYHTAVSALAQKTPVVLLPGNTFKNEGLGPMLGTSLPVFDLVEQSEVVSHAVRMVEERAAIRAELDGRVSRLRSCFPVFGRYLRKAITHDPVVFCSSQSVPSTLRPSFENELTRPGLKELYTVASTAVPSGRFLPLALRNRFLSLVAKSVEHSFSKPF